MSNNRLDFKSFKSLFSLIWSFTSLSYNPDMSCPFIIDIESTAFLYAVKTLSTSWSSFRGFCCSITDNLPLILSI